MKTTIDIAEPLLARSRQIARREHVTIRQMVEEGLSVVIARHEKPRRIRVHPVIVKGQGLAEPFRTGGWPALRDAIYSGHGS